MSQKKDNTFVFEGRCTYNIVKTIFNMPHSTFHIRELARKSNCSTTAVGTAVTELKIFDLIKIEESEVTKNIKANLESKNYGYYKLVFNLYRLGLHSFKEKLVNFFKNPECIALFGSFARGEDVEQSDIDVLIITSNKTPESSEFNIYIKQIEKEFERKLNLHILKSLKNSEDAFRNSVANGIVLSGYLKVV